MKNNNFSEIPLCFYQSIEFLNKPLSSCFVQWSQNNMIDVHIHEVNFNWEYVKNKRFWQFLFHIYIFYNW